MKRRVSAKASASRFESKMRVFDVCDKNRLGTILVAGAEVSEVRWDDAKRDSRYVPNKWLRKAKT